MIIPQLHRDYWNKDHETYSGKERNKGILRRCRPCAAPRGQSRTQDRPHARHADLHLEGRQSRRRETLAVVIGRLDIDEYREWLEQLEDAAEQEAFKVPHV